MILDVNTGQVIEDFWHPSSRPQQSELALLMRLDSFSGPGLSEAQFRSLFLKCRTCQMYVTRRTADYHTCKINTSSSSQDYNNQNAESHRATMTAERVIIDLTTDDY